MCNTIEKFKVHLWNLEEKSIGKLKECFAIATNDVNNCEKSRHREKRRFCITREKFRINIEKILETTFDWPELFLSLDPDNSGLIWLEDLFDDVLRFGQSRTTNYLLEKWKPISEDEIKIIDAPHCKKESISLIITIETTDSFCYVLISRYGQVGVYDAHFQLRYNYDIFFTRTGVKRRVRNIWIKAAVYMEDAKILVISATDKSLMFYDASALCHKPIYLITGLTYTITSMAYNCSEGKKNTSELYLGDDHGGVTIITFKQPRNEILYKKVPDKMDEMLWIDLKCILQEPFCDLKSMKRIHTWPIKRINYIKYSISLVTSSRDPNASIVITSLKGICKPYVFKYSQGVSCFFITSKFLVSGSVDGKILMWNPVVTSKPTIVYPKQDSPIIDVVILSHLEIMISLNKDSILKVFNLDNDTCIQTVFLRFPSYRILGKLIQFGYNSFHYGPTRKQFQLENLCFNKQRRSSKISSGEFGDLLKYQSIDVNETKTSEDANNTFFNDEKWNKPEIIVICCNHVAIVPTRKIIDTKTDEDEIFLPPPEKTQRIRKPSIWNENHDIREAKASIPEDPFTKIIYGNENDLRRLSRICDDENLKQLLKKSNLCNFLERNFVEEQNVKSDTFIRLFAQKCKEEEMQHLVKKGAPYTALTLVDPIEIKFSKKLPLSKRMQNLLGLEYFTEPHELLFNNSCFCMASPRSSYSNVSNNSIN